MNVNDQDRQEERSLSLGRTRSGKSVMFRTLLIEQLGDSETSIDSGTREPEIIEMTLSQRTAWKKILQSKTYSPAEKLMRLKSLF